MVTETNRPLKVAIQNTWVPSQDTKRIANATFTNKSDKFETKKCFILEKPRSNPSFIYLIEEK